MQMRQFRQAVVWGCLGWISTCPQFGVRSNALPLTFGMTPEAASAALENPLTPVAGRRGSEIYYAEGISVATGFIIRERERLWLQFRRGQLTGWRYDWDRPMAW
jgi:hypothetical protein